MWKVALNNEFITDTEYVHICMKIQWNKVEITIALSIYMCGSMRYKFFISYKVWIKTQLLNNGS